MEALSDAIRLRALGLALVQTAEPGHFHADQVGLRERTHMLSLDDLFKGRHFDREIIILCVCWYLRFKLSFRDLVEMMAERGISLAHTTIMRWIQRYVPEFEKRWNRFARQTGRSWRVDETYVKIKGRWTYLYRAVDKEGKTVDFLAARQAVECDLLRKSTVALERPAEKRFCLPASLRVLGRLAPQPGRHCESRRGPRGAWMERPSRRRA